MSDIETNLMKAINSGSFGKIQKFLLDLTEEGLDMSNLTDKIGSYELLWHAVQLKRTEIAKVFLHKGAQVNNPHKKYPNTILHLAVLNQDFELVEMLVDRGVNVDAKNYQGKTALHLAVEMGNESLVTVLLNNDAEVNTVANDQSMPIYCPLNTIERQNIFRQLFNSGADINAALCNAVINGCLDTVNYLLKNYTIDVNSNSFCLPIAVFKIQPGRMQYEVISDMLYDYGFTADLKYKNNVEFFHLIVAKGYYRILEDFIKLSIDVNNLIRHYNCDTLLHTACKFERVEIVKLLIKYGADSNIKNIDNKPPIIYSISKNNLEIFNLLLDSGAHVEKNDPTLLNEAAYVANISMIKILLERGVDVNGKNELEITGLHSVVYKANDNLMRRLSDNQARESIVNFFLNIGADVNAQITDNRSVLHLAVENNYESIVEIILKHNANVNLIDNKGRSPLFIAVKNNNEKITQILLKYNANVNLPNLNNVTPLHIAIVNKYEKLVEILLENNADTSSRYLNEDNTPLHMAIKYNFDNITKMLLKHNADVNLKNLNGSTPLHIAVKSNNLNIVKTLLENNADVNAIDKCGKTALYFAKKEDHVEIINNILKYKPKISSIYEFKTTKLHEAARTGNWLDVLDYLDDYPYDVNTINYNGSLPLHIAVENSFFGVVEYLLEYRADANFTNEQGQTSVHIAAENGSTENVVEILFQYMENTNCINKNGSTPLMIAVERNHLKLIDLIMRWGANINFKNYAGDTALHIATKIERNEIIFKLIRYGADINIENNNKTALFNAVESFKKNRYIVSNVSVLFNVFNIFIDHIKKLQAAKLYVNPKNLRIIKFFEEMQNDSISNNQIHLKYKDSEIDNIINSEHNSDADYVIGNNDQNLNEVQLMKDTKIGDSNITYYYFLTKNTHQLCKCIPFGNINETLESNNYFKTFPNYSYFIYHKFNEVVARNKMLAYFNLHIFQGTFKSLPDVCIDHIKSYLSNEDLIRIWYSSSRHY
ncbi:ankyrin-1 [Microplitis demolitor]|uniref:ankyrin-1 n=1 Tax=Microplitis demolitor TaxID=69319 RepID=UPI00235B6601|nr:ankyrin-1 [Microplitis demolitor]